MTKPFEYQIREYNNTSRKGKYIVFRDHKDSLHMFKYVEDKDPEYYLKRFSRGRKMAAKSNYETIQKKIRKSKRLSSLINKTKKYATGTFSLKELKNPKSFYKNIFDQIANKSKDVQSLINNRQKLYKNFFFTVIGKDSRGATVFQQQFRRLSSKTLSQYLNFLMMEANNKTLGSGDLLTKKQDSGHRFANLKKFVISDPKAEASDLNYRGISSFEIHVQYTNLNIVET